MTKSVQYRAKYSEISTHQSHNCHVPASISFISSGPKKSPMRNAQLNHMQCTFSASQSIYKWEYDSCPSSVQKGKIHIPEPVGTL